MGPYPQNYSFPHLVLEIIYKISYSELLPTLALPLPTELMMEITYMMMVVVMMTMMMMMGSLCYCIVAFTHT